VLLHLSFFLCFFLLKKLKFYRSDKFSHSSNHYTIRALHEEDFQQLFTSITVATDRSSLDVYFLWSLLPPVPSETGERGDRVLEREEHTDKIFYATYCMLRSLVAHQMANSVNQLWLATLNAVFVPSHARISTSGMQSSTLWGLLRVFFLEHPELNVGIVDFTEDLPLDSQFTRLLNYSAPSRQIAFREKATFSYTLSVQFPKMGPPLPFLNDGVFIVFGGTGGLGLEVAASLVERGVKTIVLATRFGVHKTLTDAKIQSKLEEMRKGAHVSVVEVDICNFAQLQQCFDNVMAKGTLRGIVHAAGVLTENNFRGQGLPFEKVTEILKTQTIGAWNIHMLSKDIESIKYFVLFSSISTVLGSFGLSFYASGKAFMDTLTHYRESLGLPCTCINWGAWVCDY
jgi:NADP-dependent 3-hydroxy acid dehydrogenase YdfG